MTDVNLSIKTGICTGIIGKSGCGKTTFLKMLGGLEEKTSGGILIFKDILSEKNIKKIRHSLGFIFQDFNLFNNMTALENITYAAKFTNQDSEKIAANVKKYIELFSIPESVLTQYPAKLSGGQKQRIAIIRSLMCENKILLIDEPTASLDEISKGEVLSVLMTLKENGITSVIVTHDLEFAKKICDEVIDFSNKNKLLVKTKDYFQN